MKEEIRLAIECPECNGTGVYRGRAEGIGVGVICSKCTGTGKYDYVFKYNPFTGRKLRSDVKRVYRTGTRFKLGLGVVKFEGIGSIDMDKEGVTYDEFIGGTLPKHIEMLGCPMLQDQAACHKLNGFVDHCNKHNDGWLPFIPDCNNKHNATECWKLFNSLVPQD